MADIATPGKTIEILQKYNFRFRKSLGQNFLIDPGVIDKIIKASSITGEDLVIEIGPGIGSQIAADFPQTADALVRAARVSM